MTTVTAAHERRPGEPPASWVEVSGAPIALRRNGPGGGDAVLFLHGSHFAGQWLPFHDRLAERCDVIYPEHPGFAEAAVPDWLEGFDDLVLHYRDLLDALELERVHLVGHALGGWIAADLAVFFPERVASMALVAPAGLRVPGHPAVDYLGMDPQRVGELLFNGDPGQHADLLPDVADIEGFARNYGETGVSVRLVWARRYDLKLERRVPRLVMPSLVVQAEDDRVIPNAHAARWSELLAGSERVTIPRTGHALLVQDPDAAAMAIASFIARCSDGQPEEDPRP